ncbi:MAG TPA: hypothetical protein VGK10_02530 [Prolixibacteraceae bacterium]|jgi:hypothetical protein
MYKNKILLITTIFILAISGLNGFLIEKGWLNINQSILNLVLDASLFLIAVFSIQNTRQIRQFLLFFFIFLGITLISFALNLDELTTITYLNGLREFIPYFLFPIIYTNILQSRWNAFFIQKFNTFLYIFLVLQIPVTLFQFSIDGAGDAVGGTQGTGFSGILTFTVFLATYYLMIQDFDENNVLRSFIKKSYLLIFWLPAFINETKITFILIPLFLFLLVKIVLSNIPKYLYLLIILIPSLYIFNFIYQNVTPQYDSKDFLSNDFLAEYLSSDNDQYEDIPRFEKLSILINNFEQREILFGKGIGQFKGGTTLSLTPFAAKYDWLLQGSVPMLFFLLVQVGIIGTLIFLVYWIVLMTIRPPKRIVNYSANLIIFSSVSFLIIQLYNDSMRFLFFCGIILYIMCYAISPTKPERS